MFKKKPAPKQTEGIESAPKPTKPPEADAAALLKKEEKLRATIAKAEAELREVRALRLLGGKQ